MRSQLIDYVHRDSPMHRMDARWKLLAVVVAIVAVVCLRTVSAAAVAFAGSLLLLSLSRLPFRWFLGRLAGVALFLSLFLILLPLTMTGDDLVLGPVRLSSQGVAIAALVCLKALAVVALALLLLATAPLEATVKAAHAMRVPSRVIQLLMLTYRYLFLLGDELRKLRIALRLKGYRNRPSGHCYRTIGHVTGTLLVRSYERAERVAQAMRCRGFAGTFRSLHSFRTTRSDVGLFALFLLLAAGVVFFDHVRLHSFQ